MPNWSESMQQTFEYYVVDPGTWGDKYELKNMKSSKISRDLEADTIETASFELTDSIGECYVRIYLVTIQNGVTEKFPLCTCLIQTPSTKFDGKSDNVSADAYSPLTELKEKYPPIGYYVPKDTNTMDSVYTSTRENLRSPVVKPSYGDPLQVDFIADPNDTWLVFLKDLMSNVDFIFSLDEMGRVLFTPKQETAALQPVWTFDDGNSSILYPDMDLDRDLYGIPNVVEVVCPTSDGKTYSYRAENRDIDSPTSVQSRGREIVYRDTNPKIVGTVTEQRVQEYAKSLLKELSSVEHTITFSHGYCPVRIGDCVLLNYERAKIKNVKAKIISQSISCVPGCPVSAKAVYSTKYWKGV